MKNTLFEKENKTVRIFKHSPFSRQIRYLYRVLGRCLWSLASEPKSSIMKYKFCFVSTGFRTNAASTDFSAILPEEVEQEVKDAAEISMGTEISDEDILNVTYLCDQVCTFFTLFIFLCCGLN